MTSQISLDDIEDELYKAGVPVHVRRRLLRAIETYAALRGKQLQPTIEWYPNKWKHLRPGDTDTREGVRRCQQCGEVWPLDREHFGADHRQPLGFRRRCLECSPEKRRWQPTRLFWCPGCETRKPLASFPTGKAAHHSSLYRCLACIG